MGGAPALPRGAAAAACDPLAPLAITASELGCSAPGALHLRLRLVQTNKVILHVTACKRLQKSYRAPRVASMQFHTDVPEKARKKPVEASALAERSPGAL